MKKILVPTDFSEVSKCAFHFGAQIAKKEGCALLVLHVVEHPSAATFKTMGISDYDPLENTYMKRMIDSVRNQLDQLLAQSEFTSIDIKTKIVIGSPYEEINEDIVSTETDLVVMGSEGADGAKELLVGSTAEKVVRTAKCPVLTVKSKCQVEDIENIVFASDFKQPAEGIAAHIREVQSLFNARLNLIIVNTPSRFTTTRHDFKLMRDFANVYGLENYSMNIYNDVDEEDGIIYFAESIDADMIALGTHGRTGLLHILAGSIAEDVTNHSKRPVWTFRIEQK